MKIRRHFISTLCRTGVWKLESADSKTPILLEFKQEGQKLTGKLKMPYGEFPLQNGSVEGQDLFST